MATEAKKISAEEVRKVMRRVLEKEKKEESEKIMSRKKSVCGKRKKVKRS